MATKSGSGNPRRKAAVGKASAPVSDAKPAAAKAARTAAARQPVGVPSSRPDVAVLDDDPTETDGPATSVDSDPGAAPKTATSQERKPWPVRLYLGEIGYEFIGNRKFWYAFSAALVLICLGSMIFKGFNLGVEFAGGERFRGPGTAAQLEEATQAVEDLGADVTSSQAVGANQLVIITADLGEERTREVTEAIADSLGVDATEITNSTTSASWGQDVTSKALKGLIVFLVLVLAFLAVRFQWKMAVGAMVALAHDLVITAGVYSLVGFEVTPASVIGLLTILGFSLYDTVVVFDKVDENERGLVASQRRTYSESANLAINQVLMRSINTSIFALLPVLGLLYAGVFLIGEGTLQDLALVLFVGLLVGMYSSIFLAVPIVCDLKEREPEYQRLAKRLNARRAGATVDKRAARITPAGDTAVAPKAAAKAGRAPGKSSAAGSKLAHPDPTDDESEVGATDPDAGDPDDQADDNLGSGGGGTLVAVARRTRPRSTRTPVGTPRTGASDTGTATSAGTGGGRAKRSR